MLFRRLISVICLGAAVPLSPGFTLVSPAPAWTVASVEEISVSGVLPQAPQWSPDGLWLSFSGARGHGIGLVRPDGSDLHWLSREPGEGWRHDWSPDSAFIVCRSRLSGHGPRQFVIRVISAATGGEISRWEAGGEVQPPFWQSGKEGMRWICQDGEGTRTGPWLVPAGRGSENAVPNPPLLHYRSMQLGRQTPEGFAPLLDVRAQDAQWNADGNQAAFDASDRIAFWDGTSTTARVLVPGQQPALSPDGRWIAYQLTRDHSHAPASEAEHTPDTMPHFHNTTTNHRIEESDIWAIAPDGTGRCRLTNTPDQLEVEPAWSPDGLRLVCRTEEGGKLLILNLKKTLP